MMSKIMVAPKTTSSTMPLMMELGRNNVVSSLRWWRDCTPQKGSRSSPSKLGTQPLRISFSSCLIRLAVEPFHVPALQRKYSRMPLALSAP